MLEIETTEGYKINLYETKDKSIVQLSIGWSKVFISKKELSKIIEFLKD